MGSCSPVETPGAETETVMQPLYEAQVVVPDQLMVIAWWGE
jgi:hypothetical protein